MNKQDLIDKLIPDIEKLFTKKINELLRDKKNTIKEFLDSPFNLLKEIGISETDNKIIDNYGNAIAKFRDTRRGEFDKFLREYIFHLIKTQTLPILKTTLPEKIKNIVNSINIQEEKILDKAYSYEFILDKSFELIKANKDKFNLIISHNYINAVKPNIKTLDLLTINPKLAQIYLKIFAVFADKEQKNDPYIITNVMSYFTKCVKPFKEIPFVMMTKMFEFSGKHPDKLYNSLSERLKTEDVDKLALANKVKISKDYGNSFYIDVLKNINKNAISSSGFKVDVSNISQIMDLDYNLLKQVPRGKLQFNLLMQIAEKYPFQVEEIINEKELPFTKREMELILKETAPRIKKANEIFYERI